MHPAGIRHTALHHRVEMPKKVDHDSRRELFMAAAYRTIKKQGIAAATFRAVAKEAGFTTGALLHYIDSMDSLLVEASEFSARDVRAKMEAAEKLPDKLDALRQVLYLALPTDSDKRGNWNFFLGFWERSVKNSRVRKTTHLRYTEWLRRTGRLIEHARDAGAIPANIDITLAARSCVALIDGIAIQTLRSGEPPTARQQQELIDQWIENWLKPLPRRKPVVSKRTRSATVA